MFTKFCTLFSRYTKLMENYLCTRKSFVRICLVLLLCVVGCAITGKNPPKIDLRPYKQIGVISFRLEDAAGNIDTVVTSKFIAAVNKAQRKSHLLRIGNWDRVQKRIEKSELNAEAAQAIGAQYDVDAVFWGVVKLSDVAPQLEESSYTANLKVLADADITLTAQLISTATGDILWAHSVTERKKLSQIQMSGKTPRFAAGDPERTYGFMFEELMYKLTADFRAQSR